MNAISNASVTQLWTNVVRRLGLTGLALISTVRGVGAVSPPAGEVPREFYVCHAGSLQAAFNEVERELARQYPGIVVKDVSGGSVALAGRMAAGLQPCDVFAAADYLDIDLLLKPIGAADYTIVFARGRMVLAYLESDPLTRGIAAAGDFHPPASIPHAAPEWYRLLLEPGVRIAGSHPFLDPAGYRSHMIFELAQSLYNAPNLYSRLLEHYTILPAVGGAAAARERTLGRDFDFQFSYEHSAAAAAKNNPEYRYVALPDRIDLSNSANRGDYAKAAVAIPGLGVPGSTSMVSIPATRVAWGLTIPKKSQNQEAASAFVQLLLGASGRTAFATYGPEPITPALVSNSDYTRLPRALRPLVAAGQVIP